MVDGLGSWAKHLKEEEMCPAAREGRPACTGELLLACLSWALSFCPFVHVSVTPFLEGGDYCLHYTDTEPEAEMRSPRSHSQ